MVDCGCCGRIDGLWWFDGHVLAFCLCCLLLVVTICCCIAFGFLLLMIVILVMLCYLHGSGFVVAGVCVCLRGLGWVIGAGADCYECVAFILCVGLPICLFVLRLFVDFVMAVVISVLGGFCGGCYGLLWLGWLLGFWVAGWFLLLLLFTVVLLSVPACLVGFCLLFCVSLV